ncbi:MAG TPA: ThuA domain-containing protein, partial [Gemmata sp.]|nr:ThuA domain-containing protein [Gemmata sp.]
QHGCGRNGIDHADDLQWQALAAKHDAALLSSWYQHTTECKDWFDPANGSERAFLTALAHFAKESRHPELEKAPWAIWGHSGGALWACHMTNRHPDRVVAVWARSQALTEYAAGALRVPIVFNYGEGEKTGRFESVHKNSQAAFTTYRPKGALWAVAVDPKSSHDCRNSRHLAIPFFDKTLAARLPAAGVELRPLDASAWLGHPTTHEVLGPRSRADNRKEYTVWLIDREFAEQWRQYSQTGEVRDSTEPPAPTAVRATVTDGGVAITWSATADLQSGLKQFVITRNRMVVATVGGEKTKANPEGFVQVWNYGDEPEPWRTRFEYLDPEGKPGDQYGVGAVNHAGRGSAMGSVVAVVAPKKVLLVSSPPDGHPSTTHEYVAGLDVLARLLKPVEGLEVTVAKAEGAWKDGPELVGRSDVVVLFLSEGAKWLSADEKRLAAFRALAKRGGGLVVLHWGMGTKDAEPVAAFVELFGACHGGPDRKHKVVECAIAPADPRHPAANGIKPSRVKEEFYYQLKMPKGDHGVKPVLLAEIDSAKETVAWAWERPGGGRSFGFSGLHFHEHWKREDYRRLVAQGVVWAAGLAVPENGLNVELPESAYELKK